MIKEGLREIINFFKVAKHLWGKCPNCDELFRLSEVVISYGAKVPKDELSKLLKERKRLLNIEERLLTEKEELDHRENEIKEEKQELISRERNLNKQVKALVKDKPFISKIIREERKDAVLRSRAILLGKLIENFAPFLQKFRHDPRDIRPLHEPIDYICFNGITAHREVRDITFIEVKTAQSPISKSERSILRAIKNGRVKSEIWHFGPKRIPLEQQLLPLPR